MYEERQGKGDGRMGADGAGLAEAAGLISRSDGAVDDLVESEPGQALAPPSSSRPHPHCLRPAYTLGALPQSLLEQVLDSG